MASGGVDISMIVTLATAAILYPLLVAVFPEPRQVFGPDTDSAPVTPQGGGATPAAR